MTPYHSKICTIYFKTGLKSIPKIIMFVLFCSALGQNFPGSTYVGENIFAIFIAIFGLVLFSSLIGNMQVILD